MGSSESKNSGAISHLENSNRALRSQLDQGRDQYNQLELNTKLFQLDQKYTNQRLEEGVSNLWDFGRDLEKKQGAWNRITDDRIARNEEIFSGFAKQQELVNFEQDKKLQKLATESSVLAENQQLMANKFGQYVQHNEKQLDGIKEVNEYLLKETSALKGHTRDIDGRLEKYKSWIILAVLGALAVKGYFVWKRGKGLEGLQELF